MVKTDRSKLYHFLGSINLWNIANVHLASPDAIIP